jgi:hypothetical protein
VVAREGHRTSTYVGDYRGVMPRVGRSFQVRETTAFLNENINTNSSVALHVAQTCSVKNVLYSYKNAKSICALQRDIKQWASCPGNSLSFPNSVAVSSGKHQQRQDTPRAGGSRPVCCSSTKIEWHMTVCSSSARARQ